MFIYGKVVGVVELVVIKFRGLKVVSVLFVDEIGKIELDLWEDYIFVVEVGRVYIIFFI